MRKHRETPQNAAKNGDGIQLAPEWGGDGIRIFGQNIYPCSFQHFYFHSEIIFLHFQFLWG